MIPMIKGEKADYIAKKIIRFHLGKKLNKSA